MKDKFIKFYLWLIIIICVLVPVKDYLNRIGFFNIPFLIISFFVSLGAFGTFILGIIAFFYMIHKGFEKIYLTVPAIDVLASIVNTFYFIIMGFYSIYSTRLDNPQAIIYFTLEVLLSVFLIIFSIYLLRRRMKKIPKKKKDSKLDVLGILAVVLGAISFIPILGILTGLAAIILGIISLTKNKGKLGLVGLILGVLGIVFTIGIYGALFYFAFMKRGGVYDQLRVQTVREQNLPQTVNAIEAYKGRFGRYPEKIEDLEQITDDSLVITDQIQLFNNLFEGNISEDAYFYYENRGDSYYVFSKGIDGIPFTDDDIFPDQKYLVGNMGYTTPFDIEGAILDTLAVGQVKTYVISGVEYETVPMVIVPQEKVTKFIVNEEVTRTLGKNEKYRLADGATLLIQEIFVGDSSNNNTSSVEFMLYKEKRK